MKEHKQTVRLLGILEITIDSKVCIHVSSRLRLHLLASVDLQQAYYIQQEKLLGKNGFLYSDF